MKLEDRGTIPTIRNKPMLVQLLEKVGNIQVVSGDDQIYRVVIENVGNRGVKKDTYSKLKQHIERYSVYRTYDYNEPRRSQVFLEPIVLPKEFREDLLKISYGITVHNEAEELERLLGKLLISIDEEDEVVICVDGDDIGVKDVVELYSIDSRVIHYDRKLDKDFSVSKNSVIEKSSGDYIFHIDGMSIQTKY